MGSCIGTCVKTIDSIDEDVSTYDLLINNQNAINTVNTTEINTTGINTTGIDTINTSDLD